MKKDLFSKFIIVVTSVLLILTFALYYSACDNDDDCVEDGDRCASSSQVLATVTAVKLNCRESTGACSPSVTASGRTF